VFDWMKLIVKVQVRSVTAASIQENAAKYKSAAPDPSCRAGACWPSLY
jgi:hypothetical protein